MRLATLSLVLLASVTGVTAFAEDRPLIGTKRGEMYPDFALPSLDGDVKRLSDYRGKRILLLHFASW